MKIKTKQDKKRLLKDEMWVIIIDITIIVVLCILTIFNKWIRSIQLLNVMKANGFKFSDNEIFCKSTKISFTGITLNSLSDSIGLHQRKYITCLIGDKELLANIENFDKNYIEVKLWCHMNDDEEILLIYDMPNKSTNAMVTFRYRIQFALYNSQREINENYAIVAIYTLIKVIITRNGRNFSLITEEKLYDRYRIVISKEDDRALLGNASIMMRQELGIFNNHRKIECIDYNLQTIVSDGNLNTILYNTIAQIYVKFLMTYDGKTLYITDIASLERFPIIIPYDLIQEVTHSNDSKFYAFYKARVVFRRSGGVPFNVFSQISIDNCAIHDEVKKDETNITDEI